MMLKLEERMTKSSGTAYVYLYAPICIVLQGETSFSGTSAVGNSEESLVLHH